MPIVAFFGDGKCSKGSVIYEQAKEVASLFAKEGFSVVSGGYQGVMSACFEGALDFPVRRIAIVAKDYSKEVSEFANEIIIAQTYLERLQKLAEIADSYVFFEGGSGTFLEFSYVWAFSERNFIHKQALCYGNFWINIANSLTNLSNKFASITKYFDFAESIREVENFIAKIKNGKSPPDLPY